MKVLIKEFGLNMQVKSRGIELEVRSADGKKQLGDLVITNSRLIWCKGRTTPKRGIRVTWDEFIAWMQS